MFLRSRQYSRSPTLKKTFSYTSLLITYQGPKIFTETGLPLIFTPIQVLPLKFYIFTICFGSLMHKGCLSSNIGISLLGNRVCMARRSMGWGVGIRYFVEVKVTARGLKPSESDS